MVERHGGSRFNIAGDNGAGANVKLMVNAPYGAQLAVSAELIEFARNSGIAADNAVEILGTTPMCNPAAKIAAGAMLSGTFAPTFPIELVAKDFGLKSGSASEMAAPVPISTADRTVYEEGDAKGFGDANIIGIVHLDKWED